MLYYNILKYSQIILLIIDTVGICCVRHKVWLVGLCVCVFVCVCVCVCVCVRVCVCVLSGRGEG